MIGDSMIPTTRANTLLDRFRHAIAPRVSFNARHFIPPIFYHYTTASGLVGIVADKHLRATNFSFMKDPSEVQHGREFVERTLVERLETVVQRHRVFFEFVTWYFGVEMAAEVYVACFTKLEDDLSQWRAYGSAAGERYAVGFDSEMIDALARSNPRAYLYQVEYKAHDQQAQIDDVLDRSLSFIDKHRVQLARIHPFAHATARRLALLMPVLKNPSYEREEEWRVVLWSNATVPHPKFDVTRGVVRRLLAASGG
jgi:Protein of unknown function (DUF2971)